MKSLNFVSVLLVAIMFMGVTTISPQPVHAQSVSLMTPQALAQYLQTLERQLALRKQQLISRLAEEARNPGSLTAPNLTCLNLTRNLAFGASGSDVVSLQTFLSETGDFDNREASGIFGFYTQSAVQSFQRREGIVVSGSPLGNGYGVVGPLTRARIKTLGCEADNSSDTPSSCRVGDIYNSVTGAHCPVVPASVPVPTPMTTYTITTSVTGVLGSGSGMIARSNAPNYPNYAPGTVVTLTATPATGSTFVGWSGNCSNLNPTCTLIMNANKSVTAIFTTGTTLPLSITRTIIASAGTGGMISPSGSISVNQGSSKTFVITPSTGYRLSQVLVDGVITGSISSAGYTFTNVQSNHTINASFAANTTISPATPSTYDLEVSSVSITTDGPRATYCNWSSVAISSFPVRIILNNVNYDFSAVGALNPGICSTRVDAFASFGLTYNSSQTYTASWTVDPNNAYSETNESNNQTSASVTGSQPPPVVASITVTAPTASSRWTPTAFTQAVTWSSSSVPSANLVTLELMMSNNVRVTAFTRVAIVNSSGNKSVNLSNITPGYYYFRLSTTVAGQIIYGDSSVFQIVNN
ncbi:MAG TPA: peptidoglycan-binding protein [Candidatus Paceibacterota bacterium]